MEKSLVRGREEKAVLKSKRFIGNKGDIYIAQFPANQKERELLLLPAPIVRVSAPDHNVGKQLWDSRLRVDDEAKQSIGFKHRKWEFSITVKDRDPDVSGLHEITVKWLRTRIRLSSRLWLLFLILLASISPNSCSGAFSPDSTRELKSAVAACLKITSILSPAARDNNFDCHKGPDGPIEEWDVSKVEDMFGLFFHMREFNGDISKWDVWKVTIMTNMFQRATSFNGDISKWDVSSVTTMSRMFNSAISFNRDLSWWNVGKVIDMSWMFAQASAFNGELSNWNVGNVITMQGMFSQTITFNQDLSKWNVGKVAEMSWMFYETTAFNQDLSNWNVGKVTDMQWMFSQAISFEQVLCGRTWIKSKANKENMFIESPGSISSRYFQPQNGKDLKSAVNACMDKFGSFF